MFCGIWDRQYVVLPFCIRSQQATREEALVAMELGDDDEEAEDEDEDEEDGGVPYEVVEVIKKMQAGATSIE